MNAMVRRGLGAVVTVFSFVVAYALYRMSSPEPQRAGYAGGGAARRASHKEECVICLDVLQQPQTMPCGHRFCRGCVASMRRHGDAGAQVCPLCRGAMPNAERLWLEASDLLAQVTRREGTPRDKNEGAPNGPPLPAALQALVGLAVTLCREALAIDPADARVHCTLGYALGAGGDAAGEEAACRAAIAADPQYARAHFNLGVVLGQRGDLAGAEAAYRAAIAADPQHAMAHDNLGVLLAKRGDPAGAEVAFRAALAADPQSAIAHYNLGNILGMRGELAGAARLFAAALKINPSNAQFKATLRLQLTRSRISAC